MDDARIALLSRTLDELIEHVDPTEHRANDPVELVWSYDDPRDQELAALCAASVAYGRVALVRDAGRRIMEVLGDAPVEALLHLDLEDLEQAFEHYVYRMTRGADVVDLLWGARALYEEYGSLDAAYGAMEGDDHLTRASHFVQALRAGRARQEVTRGLKYLVSDPADGSASKRLHLFFRWVGRGPDAIDLGIWEHLDAADLIMPMDTHTSRICRYIGLCARKSVDGKAALEVTRNLRRLDADDPLRYDFAICHLGISGGCIHRRSEEHCPTCPLDTICALN